MTGSALEIIALASALALPVPPSGEYAQRPPYAPLPSPREEVVTRYALPEERIPSLRLTTKTLRKLYR